MKAVVRAKPGSRLRPADRVNDVSKFIQQAKATTTLLSECLEAQQVTIDGTAAETLSNALWAIEDLLDQAQHALNDGEVLNGQG